MVRKAQQETQSFLPNATLQSVDASFGWERYFTDAFEKFLSASIVQLGNAFEQIEFSMGFDILDPRKLPKRKEDLIQYGDNELQYLGEHYGAQKVIRFEGKVSAQDADIDAIALTEE